MIYPPQHWSSWPSDLLPAAISPSPTPVISSKQWSHTHPVIYSQQWLTPTPHYNDLLPTVISHNPVIYTPTTPDNLLSVLITHNPLQWSNPSDQWSIHSSDPSLPHPHSDVLTAVVRPPGPHPSHLVSSGVYVTAPWHFSTWYLHGPAISSSYPPHLPPRHRTSRQNCNISRNS